MLPQKQSAPSPSAIRGDCSSVFQHPNSLFLHLTCDFYALKHILSANVDNPDEPTKAERCFGGKTPFHTYKTYVFTSSMVVSGATPVIRYRRHRKSARRSRFSTSTAKISERLADFARKHSRFIMFLASSSYIVFTTFAPQTRALHKGITLLRATFLSIFKASVKK